jgi:hypothetical protein
MTVKLTGSLMEMENAILDSCNEMGCLATAEALQKFDTDGSPIKLGDTKLTVRAKDNKTYQTPYGSVQIQRYVYQTSKGGQIHCPLEGNARIIRGATPKFAQQIAHKYANMNAPAVCQDLGNSQKIPHTNFYTILFKIDISYKHTITDRNLEHDPFI